ncbi:50S ribosomal protein L11 [Candidatus Vidania fulgoroideorum]
MKKILNITLKSGIAKPNSNLSSCLAPKGINVNLFCKKFNEESKKYDKGSELPLKVIIYSDKKYKIFIKSPTTFFLFKKYKKKIKNIEKIIKKIIKIKSKDLNSLSYEKNKNTIIGCIKSYGLKYE